MYHVVCPTKLYSYTSLLRAYRGEVVRSVRFDSDGFVAVAEILLRAIQSGYRVTEVPTVLHVRSTGASKMKVSRTILTHLGLASRILASRLFSSGVQPRKPAESSRSAKG